MVSVELVRVLDWVIVALVDEAVCVALKLEEVLVWVAVVRLDEVFVWVAVVWRGRGSR